MVNSHPKLKDQRAQRINFIGGAVAEWSKALLVREKINENKKDPRFAPRPGQTLKKFITQSELKLEFSYS